MDNTSNFFSLLLQAAFATSPVAVSTSATYQFSPSISQEEGCKRAEERAKTVALQKVFGQDFGADSTMSCRETDKHACNSITNTYENTRGYIESITNRSEKVDGWNCTVSLTASIREPRKYKTDLEVQATLNRVVYTNDDVISINVASNKSGAVTIYKYDPVSDIAEKIFPPPPNQRWNGAYNVHNNNPLVYRMRADAISPRDEPYYLFVMVTGGSMQPMSKYRLHEMYRMWDNLATEEAALVRKSFYVSRSKL